MFCKTKDGTNITDISFAPISSGIDSKYDFDYDAANKIIYYCGQANNQAFIVFEDINNFFTAGNNHTKVDLNLSYISKIYYYVDANGNRKLALIADGNNFVDFDLGTYDYVVYESPYQLLDMP